MYRIKTKHKRNQKICYAIGHHITKGGISMTVQQAVKKFKLEPINEYSAKAKAKELNVEQVLYMNVQKNKFAYLVKDGARGYMLYQDEKSFSTKLFKGLKMTPLDP